MAYKWTWIATARGQLEEIVIAEGRHTYAKLADCVRAAHKESYDVPDCWGGPYLVIREVVE